MLGRQGGIKSARTKNDAHRRSFSMSHGLFCWVPSSSVLCNVSSTPELSIAADKTEGIGKAVKTDPHARRGLSKAAEMARVGGEGGGVEMEGKPGAWVSRPKRLRPHTTTHRPCPLFVVRNGHVRILFDQNLVFHFDGQKRSEKTPQKRENCDDANSISINQLKNGRFVLLQKSSKRLGPCSPRGW